jgi:UDP-3-O-[3-hydroxymyristoyl] N-acetylglucosamine deacetylase/3-hydroxyacyl-[acyl-carrier-protein] dehydratase
VTTLPQTTLRKPATIQGPGLFTGEPATLTLRPADPGSGIRFVRIHDGHRSVIPARIEHLMEAPRRTALRNGKLSVETVEHCLAACAGMGVRNAEIELSHTSTGELPMGDGSSRLFVEAIDEAGIEEQDGEPVLPLVITEPVHVQAGDATVAALPGPTDHLEIVYTFEAPEPVGRQVFCFHLMDGQAADDFTRDVAPARTFIFEEEVEALKERGLGGHLTHQDLVVIGASGPIDNDFRFPDECVRHKVLDLIGDLSLVGRPVFGRLVANRSGHELNHVLARRLLEMEASRTLALLPRAAEPVLPPASDFRDLVGRPAADAALDIRKIQRILPHRFPMLLVDRVLKIEGDQRAIGLKNITMGDVFFLGHYPGAPIFPGVLIVEAMAQLGGILLSRKLDNTGKLAVLLSMDNVKLRQPVVPGDQLILEAEAVRVKSRTGHVRCSAYVCERLAAEADIKFMLVDAET